MDLQTLKVRGLDVAYTVWGSLEGASSYVLCFHGFLDHGHAFAPIARALAPRPVVAIDFRGFGRSGWIGDGGYYYFPDYIADAAALHAHLGADKKVDLVAHSMGGSVATAFTAVRPEVVRSIVMLEGMGPPREDLDTAPDKLRRWINALADPILAGDIAHRRMVRKPMADVREAANRMLRINPKISDALALEHAAYGSEPDPRGGIVWRFDPLHRTPAARPFNADEYAHHWKSITAPVLSLYGDATEWALPDLAARHALVNGCVSARVEGAGHNIHHDRPELVAEVVRRWIDGDRAEFPPGVTRVAL